VLRKLILLASLLLPSVASAQYVRYDGFILGNRGPLGGQSVAVCAQPAVTTTQPCSPLASLYQSSAGTALPNPTASDSYGNFHFYVSPGVYTVQIYGPQVYTPYVLADQIIGTTTGTFSSFFIVDGLTYTTIQAAITAAGTSGTVFIPDSYTGTDTYTNPNNIVVLDFRAQNATSFTTGALGLWHGIHSGPNVTNLPGGNDLPIVAAGPGSIILQVQKVATTTTASLAVGANPSVPVGSTAGMGTADGAPLLVGRGTANQEEVVGGNWSIVNSTTMSITCAKTHSGTTDVEQVGNISVDANSVTIQGTNSPAQNPNTSLPIVDLNLSPIMFLPRNTEQGGSLGVLAVSNIMLAANPSNPGGGNALLGFQLAGASSNLPPYNVNATYLYPNSSGVLVNATPSLNVLGFLGPFVSYNAHPAQTQVVQLANADAVAWRNAANSGDIYLYVDAHNLLNFNGSPALAAGNITMAAGTGSHTFAEAYPSAPACTATDSTAANAVKVTSSTTTVTVTGTGTDVVSWICLTSGLN
jgi:hypothetical protein